MVGPLRRRNVVVSTTLRIYPPGFHSGSSGCDWPILLVARTFSRCFPGGSATRAFHSRKEYLPKSSPRAGADPCRAAVRRDDDIGNSISAVERDAPQGEVRIRRHGRSDGDVGQERTDVEAADRDRARRRLAGFDAGAGVLGMR